MMAFPHIRRVLLAMTVLLTVFSARGAAAQTSGPTPAFFLLPTQSVRSSVTSIVPERIGELLREQITRDPRVKLMPGYDELRKQLGGSSAAVAEAEELYTSGIGLLTAGEDKQAAERFQRALDIMEENLTDLENLNVLEDTLLNLALAYHNAGFDLDGRKRMQRFAHLRTDATLDPEKFPKELIEVYTEEVAKVKAAGPGKLKVTAKGDGGTVFIDGVEKGKTPATIDDVGFGYHYLVVRGTNGSVWSDQIRVRGRKKSQTFEAELAAGAPTTNTAKEGELPSFYTDLLARIESGTFGTDLGPYLAELASQTGADHIGWVVMYRDGSDYVAAPFAYRAKDQTIARGENVLFNIELSNLLAGVSSLSKSTVDLALAMPADAVVTTAVTLGEPAPAVATTTTTTATTAATSTATTGTGTSAYAAGTGIKKQHTPPSKKGNTWTYIGVAAGGLVLVGLVAGGIYLLSQDGNPSAAPGFNTEVTW